MDTDAPADVQAQIIAVTPDPDDQSKLLNNKPLVHHEFTFPPFPAVPEGVVIIPFALFKERGISIEAGPDGDEVDSLGIATVPMSKRHSNDECKTKATKRKGEWDSKGRKKKKKASNENGGEPPKWWEVWEDGELTRYGTSHNPGLLSQRQKLVLNTSGKRQLRRFLGVSDTVRQESATQKKKRQKIFGPDSDIDSSDDEVNSGHEEDAPANDNTAQEPVDASGGIVNIPSEAGETGILDATVLLIEKTIRQNEEKVYAFFDDPDKTFKTFMSSYGRRIGLYWSDENLDIIPRLLRFFVNFVLRSNALPEIDRELKKTLPLFKIALQEMPASATLSRSIPDRFSRACRSSWGKKTESFYFGSEDWPAAADPPVSSDAADGTAGQAEVDADSANKGAGGWGAWGENPSATEGDNSNPWGGTVGWANDVINDDVEEPDNTMWRAVEENLISLLGPTTFLLTHKAGVVERSMRMIKAIHPPGPNIPLDIVQGSFSLESTAVELQLERRFTMVVLGTMEDGWDGGEYPVYSRPEILSTSDGAVIINADSPLPDTLPGATPPHNPLTDNITLLVDKDAPYLKDMHVGMGLGGTWVQIARDVLPKKKKGKKLKPAPSIWYVSELNIVIPSFWTISEAIYSK
ncbi:hypothetical protein CVT24_011871 [Panaeolus cyanescens]|uniref:Uncharacterized protein n=1 Tax=Panaeolus cyanescens TaxID=181874 RepID=A0A409YNJ6_9AGAR|nr:hypothetical protein CVT24_011871 [Panaeolus cyanescens]